MGVKCLAQEHNAVPRPGLEPGPFDPESSALTIRPPRLPQFYCYPLFDYKCKSLLLFLSASDDSRNPIKIGLVTTGFDIFLFMKFEIFLSLSTTQDLS